MKVKIKARVNKSFERTDVVAIEKKQFHIFLTDSEGNIYVYELDDVEKIEVEL